MFVGIPPLLDILHCYFLHGAAWHGLPPGLSASVRQKQKRFLVVGSQERWDPLEKSLHGDASLLIRRSLRSPRCASLLNVATSDFLFSVRARTRQEFRSAPHPPSSSSSSSAPSSQSVAGPVPSRRCAPSEPSQPIPALGLRLGPTLRVTPEDRGPRPVGCEPMREVTGSQQKQAVEVK